MYASIHRGREVQAQFFIYLRPPPSPGRQKSLNHSSIWQERRRLGTRFLLDADDDRGPEGLGHLREQEPFYREQVLLCDIFTSLYEYIEHPRDRRATMLHPY